MLVFRRDMDVSNHSNWQHLRTEMRYTRTHHFHLQMKVWFSELEPSPYLGTGEPEKWRRSRNVY